MIGLTDGEFYSDLDKPAGWYHLVMNYIGSADGQGITVYTDGAVQGSGTSKYTQTEQPADGRVVIGRYYTDNDERYASVLVDELTLWNRTLTLQEIQAVYNMHK